MSLTRVSESTTDLVARLRAASAAHPPPDPDRPTFRELYARNDAPQLAQDGLEEVPPPTDDDAPADVHSADLGPLLVGGQVDVVRYLQGLAAAGTSAHPVHLADLAEVMAEGCCRTSHQDRAEALGLSMDTVRRVRQSYGRRLVGDPDAPWLRYTPGHTDAGGRWPSRVDLVDQVDGRQLRLPVQCGQAVENFGGNRGELSLGVAVPATPTRTGQVSGSRGVFPLRPSGSGGPGGARSALESDTGGEDRPRRRRGRAQAAEEPQGGSKLDGSRSDGGPVDGEGSGSWEDTGRGVVAGDGTAAPEPPAGAGDLVDVPTSAAQVPELWAEAKAQARRLLAEARAARVLDNPRAYCQPEHLARALLLLRYRFAGFDPAVRCVRAEILHLLQQRETPDGVPRAGFPGRAVLLFLRPAVVRSAWWTQGAGEGWGAPGWRRAPQWADVPGWEPATDPAALQLLADDPSLQVLHRRRTRGDRRALELADQVDRYNPRLRPELADQPGGRALAALQSRTPNPWVAAVVEGLVDRGPDLVGSLRRLQAAAADGSDLAAEALRRLDKLAQGQPLPENTEPLALSAGELWGTR